MEDLGSKLDKFDEKFINVQDNLNFMKELIDALRLENKQLKDKIEVFCKCVKESQSDEHLQKNIQLITSSSVENGENIEDSDKLIKNELNSIFKNTWSASKFEDIINKLLQLKYDGKKTDLYGNTPLHYAVKYGYTDIAKCLIDHYIDFDISDTIFSSPLHVERELGDSIFDNLKYSNSDLIKIVNKKDNDGKSSLHYSIERKDYDMACTLLLRGASINSISIDAQKELLRYSAEITHAAYYDPHELRSVVGLLAIKVPEAVSDFSIKYQYPRLLSFYCTYGHTKVIDALLRVIKDEDKKKHILNSADNGLTPLDRVNSGVLSDRDHLKIIKYLLENGATKASNNINPIYITLKSAACEGHEETFKYLIEWEDNKKINTYIGLACQHDRMNIVQYLWSNYRKYIVDSDGNTALHYAIQRGSIQSIRYLCENGADVNKANTYGRTPLHYAIKGNRDDIVEYLIKKGAK